MSSEFHLSFNILPSEIKFGHEDHIGFLGSCFSDEMYQKASFYGFNCTSNPFGTVFHPLAISRFVQECCDENQGERILQRNDLFFSEDAGSKVFGFTFEIITDQLKTIRKGWKDQLQNMKILFITFGTAWGYRSNTSGKIVANCHKLPGTHFTKELTPINEIVTDWQKAIEKLKELNPQLHIVFTVSPVRHIRDGLIENNRSKAILIEAVRQLNEQTGTGYFPSYEFVMDELRDYRFFKEDRVHPNNEAIDHVWEKLINCYCSEKTRQIMQEVRRYRLSVQHKSLFEGSVEDTKHKEGVIELRRDLMKKYPSVKL